MIERPVELICTDLRQHPLRELAVVVPVEPRVDLHAMALEAGVRVPEETPDERRGFGVRSSLTTVAGQHVSVRHKTDVEVRQGRSGKWTVYVECPTCRRPKRVPMDTVVQYERARPDTPRLELDVSVLDRTH